MIRPGFDECSLVGLSRMRWVRRSTGSALPRPRWGGVFEPPRAFDPGKANGRAVLACCGPSPCTVPAVSSDDPYVRLPEHIELTLAEAGELLEVLDIAAVVARTDDERAAVSDAAHMITTKLWSELGDLLDGDDET